MQDGRVVLRMVSSFIWVLWWRCFLVAVLVNERLHFDSAVCRQTRNSLSRFREHLELIKFICKELWISIFGKPIDNLRTNHKVGLGYSR